MLLYGIGILLFILEINLTSNYQRMSFACICFMLAVPMYGIALSDKPSNVIPPIVTVQQKLLNNCIKNVDNDHTCIVVSIPLHPDKVN
jgi:hypothetical protein